ncbi:MAG: hypothetical protein IJD59_10955 [Clostridia bacterium]|nr:hypothetical protein [Clostridia bacterium]
MKQKLAAFFSGRYGADELAKAMLILYIVISAVTVFVGNATLRIVLNVLSLTVCIFMFYRMFSKKIAKRAEENRKYLLLRRNTKQWFLLRRNKWTYRKTHVYRSCPHCGAQIRLPRVAGDHRCDCPKCQERFSVHIK